MCRKSRDLQVNTRGEELLLLKVFIGSIVIYIVLAFLAWHTGCYTKLSELQMCDAQVNYSEIIDILTLFGLFTILHKRNCRPNQFGVCEKVVETSLCAPYTQIDHQSNSNFGAELYIPTSSTLVSEIWQNQCQTRHPSIWSQIHTYSTSSSGLFSLKVYVWDLSANPRPATRYHLSGSRAGRDIIHIVHPDVFVFLGVSHDPSWIA